MRSHDHSPYFAASLCTQCLAGSPAQNEVLLQSRLLVANERIRALLALHLDRPGGVIDLLSGASKLWAVRTMHRREPGLTSCQECHKPWPCPTRIATEED